VIRIDYSAPKRSYHEFMGEERAHIRLKLDNSQPIALSDFVSQFVGVGSQFERFIAREYPNLKGESEFYVNEVRAGCIEADFVAWIVGGGLFTAGAVAIDAVDKLQIFTKFVQDFGGKFSRYFKPGGRAEGVSKGDLGDFLKTAEAIANDPNGSARLEAAGFEDGERNVRAFFQFSTAEAKQAEKEIANHRRELEITLDENQERVLLRFVRPSVEAGKPGKKGGERGVIESIAKRAMPILYASDLAEQRMRHEKIQLEGNIFRAIFDVSVNVELSQTGQPIAYRVTEVHTVIEDDSSDGFIDA
jgi:hypothetical protein